MFPALIDADAAPRRIAGTPVAILVCGRQFPGKATQTQCDTRSIEVVIARLDPAIHHLRQTLRAREMDPRVKPAGDS
jgi:hypothetical protein